MLLKEEDYTHKEEEVITHRGGFRGGSRGSAEPPFVLYFLYFHGEVWINLINLGYRICPKYHTPYSLPYAFLIKSI